MAIKISRYLPAIAAWFILFGVTGVFYALVIPGVIKEFQSLGIILTIGEALLMVAVMANFFMATVMDPGVLPKATESEEQQQDEFRAPLYKNADVKGISVRMKWCTTCHFYRPPRCSHCSICDHCIDTFDHHCPWLNNCIGRRNYKQFFIFLILLTLHIIFVVSLCMVYTIRMKNNLLTKENLGSISVMVLGGLLFVPIAGLTGFHVFLVVTGRTTNEQVTGKFRSGYNPFDQGICRNLALVCFGPQFPRVSNYIGKQEPADLGRLSGKGAKTVEASAPLLNAATVPVNNHRHADAVSPDHIQLYGADGPDLLPFKKRHVDGNVAKIQQSMRSPSDISSDGKSATGGVFSTSERSRSSVTSRSRSSVGEQRSDEISLSRLAADDGNISRDSSLVTIRVFPKSGSVGFPPLLRPGDADSIDTSTLEAQGSKCNLLDETGSALDAPGILYSKQLAGGGDSAPASDGDPSRRDDEYIISSPGSERYQQVLREAYSGAIVRHKPPVLIRPMPQSAPRRGLLQNGPMTQTYGGYRTPATVSSGDGCGDGVMRFAYVPPSSILKSSVVNKSHSMDGLGRSPMVHSSIPHYQPATPPRLSLAPTLSSSTASDFSYSGYKRPLSFTQAVQLHDSLTRLNNGNSRGANASLANRPRSDTSSSASAAQGGNVNEIRV